MSASGGVSPSSLGPKAYSPGGLAGPASGDKSPFRVGLGAYSPGGLVWPDSGGESPSHITPGAYSRGGPEGRACGGAPPWALLSVNLSSFLGGRQLGVKVGDQMSRREAILSRVPVIWLWTTFVTVCGSGSHSPLVGEVCLFLQCARSPNLTSRCLVPCILS